MKTLFLLLLACLANFFSYAQTGDSTEAFEPAPFRLRFSSFEAPAVTGSLALSLNLDAQANATETGYQGVSDSKGFFSYDDAQMRAIGSSPSAASAGPVASQTATFYLQYNPNNLPFYPVRVQVALAYTPAGGGVSRPYQRDCYVYFTPYQTVEVWDQADYENLRRQWLTDDGQPSSARVAVNRADIPVSDIPSGYQAAAGEEFDMEYVPGLAYAVPKLYPNFQGYQDGTGNNPPPPGSAGRALAQYLFKGQITNQRIFTFHRPDGIFQLVQLPLRRGRIEVWWDVRGGRDQHVKTFYTDNEGYLTENGSRTVRFAFNSHGSSSQPEQVYLRIKMQDQWGLNKVWGPTAGVLTTDTPRQLLAYNANSTVFPALAFGLPTPVDNAIELPETQGLKPFTWIMACRDHVWNALSGNSLQGSQSLIVYLTNNPEEGNYRARERAIRLGATTRVAEFVVMHEVGHFVMHDLTRAKELPGPGGEHSGAFNNSSPATTITEGFANGFAFIMDEMTFQDLDQESGEGWVGGYHPRITFGSGANPNLTNPFVSELTMGKIMLDLWDGPNNLAAVNNPRPAVDYEDPADATLGYGERYEMPLVEILRPLFYNSAATIGNYFGGLLRDNATNAAENQRIREVWYYNFSAADALINTAAFRVLNIDEIDPAVTFTTPKFSDVRTNGIPNGTITVTYPNTDTGVLNGNGQSFNVTTYVRDTYDAIGRRISSETKNANGVTLTDPVQVANGAELGLHSGAQPRWYNQSSGLTTYTKRTDHLEIALRAQARLTVGNDSRIAIGSVSPYQTTSVSLYDGTYLVVEDGATLAIAAGSTLNLWEGATLLVRNGGNVVVDGDLMIRWGSHLCIEQGGNVRASASSLVYVDGGARMGVPAGLGLPTTLACTNQISACGRAEIFNSGVANIGGRSEALQFDGNDVVTVPNTNSYVNELGQQFSIEAYIRADNLNAPDGQTIFSSRKFSSTGTGTYNGVLFTVYGGRLLLQLDGRNYFSDGTLLPNDNGCHHVAVTRDHTNRVRFYIDRFESWYSPNTALSAFSDAPLNVGADNLYGTHGEYFQGMIGELRVWNQWRSGEQIKQTFTQRPAAPQAGLVVSYDMQDPATSQSLSDLSGVAQTGRNAVPGVLGTSPAAGPDDPTWVSNCAVACTVQGNFRTGPLTWTAPDSAATRPARPPKPGTKAVTALSISPNPASSTATLHFDLPKAGTVRVTVQDLAGAERAVVLQQTHLAAGAQQLQLPIQQLPPGLYLVVAHCRGEREHIRLEVQ